MKVLLIILFVAVIALFATEKKDTLSVIGCDTIKVVKTIKDTSEVIGCDTIKIVRTFKDTTIQMLINVDTLKVKPVKAPKKEKKSKKKEKKKK